MCVCVCVCVCVVCVCRYRVSGGTGGSSSEDEFYDRKERELFASRESGRDSGEWSTHHLCKHVHVQFTYMYNVYVMYIHMCIQITVYKCTHVHVYNMYCMYVRS